jgi:hypothetical protein
LQANPYVLPASALGIVELCRSPDLGQVEHLSIVMTEVLRHQSHLVCARVLQCTCV